MKEIYRRMNRGLAVLLACALFFNNENIYFAFAAENVASETTDAGSSIDIPEDVDESGGGSPKPEGGDESGGSQQPGAGDESSSPKPEGGDELTSPKPEGGDELTSPKPEGGDELTSPKPEGGDELSSPKPEGGDELSSPKPGEELPKEELPEEEIDKIEEDEAADEIPPCLEDKAHEYEILTEEGSEEVLFRCVFCYREIDAETYEKEDAVLHEHKWSRPEGELIPLCEACGTQRLDCDGEDGYGIHIFELIQEEGMPDKYRCVICGEEKDSLDEWDMTVELFQEIAGIGLYATDMGKLGEPTIPEDWDMLVADDRGTTRGKPILVNTLADLIVLQELSKGHDFAGLYVALQNIGTGGVWDLTPLKDSETECNIKFVGLGTETNPFKGTLCSYYTDGSVSYKTATPLINYLGTEGTVSDMLIEADITGDGSSPAGVIASHVVKTGASDTVNLEKISVSGTVTNNGGAAGGLFGEVVNSDNAAIKIQYTDASSVVVGTDSTPLTVSAGMAGGLVGKTTGKVDLYQTDVFPKGIITGTESAGMLAGSMEQGGTLYVKGADAGEILVNVQGSGVSGGLVGKTDAGKVARESTKEIIITGEVKGGTAGGLVGECINTEVKLDDITVSESMSITASSQSAGGIIGHVKGSLTGSADLDSAKWNLLHHISIAGNVTGGENAGGVVGFLESSNFQIGLPDEAPNFDCIKITGAISAIEQAGGMVGAAKGQYIEVHNSSNSGTVSGADSVGGIFGSVKSNDVTEHTVVKASNVQISATLKDSSINRYGGIFGEVCSNSMAALDKEINVDALNIAGGSNENTERGYIAGCQQEALIYLEEGSTYKRPSPEPEIPNWKDDIGNYGGVYRNGSWGDSPGPLISYTQKDVTGSVESNGSQWKLDSEADVMRLAIMLNTEGNFAGGCFNNAKSALLAGDYLLTKTVYNLENSGIYALNRNDAKGLDDDQCFTGSFLGNDGTRAVLNLGSCITYQSNISLFPKVGNGAEFGNLTVKRTIKRARGAAGLAVEASDNVTVNNVAIEMDLTGSVKAREYYYGGMFAEYQAGASTTLSVENSRIGGSMTIYEGPNKNTQYLGGLIAKYESGATGSNLPTIQIDGLEIGAEITSDSRLASGMITQMNAGSGVSEDKVILNMQNIHVKDGAKLIIEDGGDAGGFLGREWRGLVPYDNGTESYSIKGLTVGESTQGRPEYRANGPFGGMICTVTGRIQLKDAHINHLLVNSNVPRNGLLFRNGHNALIELEDYRIAGKDVGAGNTYPDLNGAVQVTGNAGNFSDIVGNNIVDENGYTSGGIVNIISPAFGTNFYSYSSHKLGGSDGGSAYTRYYYNLFGTSMSLQEENNYLQGKLLNPGDVVIENAEQLMIWHLYHYMNPSIKRYLSVYFDGGTLPASITETTISGSIDLNHKSYYPTPVSGCTIKGINSAEIKFYGDKIAEGTTKKPSENKENYMMHSGLLLSAAGNVTVQGDEDYLTLSGGVSYIGSHSGALFSRGISGVNNIYRILLKDCYVSGYNGEEHGVGLLIGAINDGTKDAPTDVDISWVKTENYTHSQNYAASALIGRVGSNDTKNLMLDFSNMKLHDKNKANGGIFRWASFIDDNQYTQSTEENNGHIWYLFTKEAYEGGNGSSNTREPFTDDIHGNNDYTGLGSTPPVFVTIGSELEDGVEYWNVDGTDADFLAEITNRNEWGTYLPYVCKAHTPASRDIEVNPKNVGITEGCGTYEDPYVITSAKQILALSCYLSSGVNADGSKTEPYLEGWKIRRVGDRSDNGADTPSICNKTHNDTTLKEYGKDADFPSQDDLRQAYYRIKDDIDFSALKSPTDGKRARDFVGIGTEEMPFSGVIVGEKENGGIPVITLPYKPVNNVSPNNFGLIQYAKGAVVKDLKIVGPGQSADSQFTNVIRVANMGSPVIACILGGDNIIDNVQTGGMLAVRTSGGNDTAIGGYVGVVQQGSLILRNLKPDNFASFQCGKLENNGQTIKTFEGTEVPSSYPFISAAIGKVENGFVIYEDDNYAGTDPVLTHEGKTIDGVYTYTNLPFSNSYDVIRASGMKNEKGKIEITQSGNDFTCTIANTQQLQLVSMAINSDSFSVYYDGGGYDRQAVCRKAKYDKVGDVPIDAPGDDYNSATGNDNLTYWHPYIYQYFKFGSGTNFLISLEEYPKNSGSGKYRSKLNAVTADVSSVMTYELTDTASEIDYDLSVYKRGFRGLGATYRVFEPGNRRGIPSVSIEPVKTVYSDFRANFNGNDATVKAEMINDYSREIHTTALFNDLVKCKDYAVGYEIKDLVITGTFISCFAEDNVVNENQNKYNYEEDRAAAAVGMMLYPCKLNNIIAKDVIVKSKGHAAGIVAWIKPYDSDNKAFEINKCQVKDTGKQSQSGITARGGSCGGIVGLMAAQYGGMAMQNISLTLTSCKVKGSDENHMLSIINEGEAAPALTDNSDERYERYGRGRSGALIGYVGRRHNSGGQAHEFLVTVTGDTTDTDADVKYVSVTGAESTGGVIGEYSSWRTGNEVALSVSDITVSSSYIQSTKPNAPNGTFGVGGIIGTLRKDVVCNIENITVKNTNVVSAYGMDNAVSDTGVSQGDLHAGGIIGSYYHDNIRLTIKNATVTGELSADGKPQYEIRSRLSHAGGIIGASVKSGPTHTDTTVGSVTIENAQVSGMNIQSDSRSQADKNADKAAGTSKGAAGGVIGQVMRSNLNVTGSAGQPVVDNCIIRSGIGSAGGVIGSAGDGSNTAALDTSLENVEVTNSTIGSNGSISKIQDKAGAGGIYGRICALEDGGSQKLHGLSVESCVLYGKNVGGIAGAVDENQKVGNIWSSKNSAEITVTGNKLLGYHAGGGFGLDKSKLLCFEKVKITGNTILACRNDEDYSAAGGFAGRKENSESDADSHTINSVDVEGNRIFSSNLLDKKQAAGGVFGYLNLTKEIYSDKASVINNHIGYLDVSDEIEKAVSTTEMEGQMEAVKQGLEQAASGTPQLWDGSKYADLPADLAENQIKNYAAYYGNLAGGYTESGHAYFLEPVVSYDDTITNRPAVDVGRQVNTTGTDPGNKMLSDPYAYRENIHVVYFEPDNSADNTAAAVWDGKVLGKETLFSQVNLEKVLEAYGSALTGTTAEKLDAYRLNLTDDSNKSVQDIYKLVYKNGDDYQSPFKVGGSALPMIYMDMQHGTVDQLLTSVLAALTNAGGIQNSGNTNKKEAYDAGIGRVMTFQSTPYTITSGAISEGTGDASVEMKGDENRWEATYNGYNRAKDESNGTFTLLTVTYSQKDYQPIDGGTTKTGEKVVLNIPIFLEERLNIDTHIKIVEGEAYNAEKAKEEGAFRTPVLANDSSYTLYMEYIYGSARGKYSTDTEPLYVDKKLEMTKVDGNDKFWAGTRLTLIDVADSDKVYYYTVTEDTPDSISFDLFKDADGVPYGYKKVGDDFVRDESKAIHNNAGKEIYGPDQIFTTKDAAEDESGDAEYQYQDVAVEKFLVVVDTSGVEKEIKVGTTDVRGFHTKPELVPPKDSSIGNIEERTTITEHTNLSVTRQATLDIGLTRKGQEGGTDINGTLQSGEEIVIDAAFLISGQEAYWRRLFIDNVSLIDSANSHKYLEVGIYLTDTDGNRVRLPDNTNVTVKGMQKEPVEEEIKPEENLGAYVNRTEAYFYRDGKIEFAMDELQSIMKKPFDEDKKCDLEEELNIVLNFSNADLSTYAKEKYQVHIELLRIEDKDYPAGGELIDHYSDNVDAKRKADLACALEASNLMQLGINTYQKQTSMPHIINFDFKLDFNDILNDNETWNQQEIENKYFTVTYHILEKKKTGGTMIYDNYTKDQLELSLVEPPDGSTLKKDGPSATGKLCNSVYVTYKFDLSEVKSGTGDAGKGVIVRKMALTVKDAEKMDLSNYKIQASVLVSDSPPENIEEQVNQSLSDFFVFTIAKLKTDLDY